MENLKIQEKKKDYFNCRKCGEYKSNKYYFKCSVCKSKFCTNCPNNNNNIERYSCPLCGEPFLNGKFENSGEKKDYFDCRTCGEYKSNKYYFKCYKCGGKFCTKCPKN